VCNIVRKIVFNGFDTLASGIRINSMRTETSGVEIRTAKDTISYRDGAIMRPAGEDTAKLTYCLILREASRAGLQAKVRQIVEKLKGARGDLFDSDLPGKKYINAVFTGADPLEFVSRNFTTAYMMIHFEADPVPQEASAVSERVLRFSANGNATLTVTDNSSYTITAGGGTTSGGFAFSEPYKYRVGCYAENPETITLNGWEITAEEVFTMPASAEIAISATGYKYVELWHDTREVRL
jgi:hypothetical protein